MNSINNSTSTFETNLIFGLPRACEKEGVLVSVRFTHIFFREVEGLLLKVCLYLRHDNGRHYVNGTTIA